MLEHTILLQKHFRYFLSEDFTQKRKLLIALHGYGQLALYFAKKFSQIPEDYALLAPEGMHRFYLQGSSGRVGASWMTKEGRELDIEDNLRNLNQLLSSVMEHHVFDEICLLGFSQGGATAARWYYQGPSRFDRFILWASVFPPDIEKPVRSTGNTHFVLGTDDPYYTTENQAKERAYFTEIGFQVHRFDGTHDLDASLLNQLLK
ncbi:MAG: alpha/beta hydrolase [Flavobacteriales bacterium]